MAAGGNLLFPNSPLARSIANLFDVTLVICAIIFVLVTVLVTYCIIRFRARPGEPPPAQVGGHKALEILWTVVPFLILVFIFFLTVAAMRTSDPRRIPKQQPDIVVIGHQFWWEARYPKSGVVTANEIHIPTGRPILIHVGTADVIHSFWVPALGRKMDMIPDRFNAMWISADTPGTYLGACSEYCGAEHAWMRISVIAESPDEFNAWIAHQLGTAPEPSSGATMRGAELFQRMTCVNCHAIAGIPAAQSVGPNLTHIASRRTLGAGVLTNTPENLGLWIRNSQLFKPGNLMPRMNLTDAQLTDLVAYLETLQ